MADRESTTGPTAKAGTKRKRPWLRRVGVVVGCLLAGAIINVLVAWVIALFSADDWGHYSAFIFDATLVSHVRETETIALLQVDMVGREAIAVVGVINADGETWKPDSSAYVRRGQAIRELPRWARSAFGPQQRLDEVFRVVATGFPLRTFRATFRYQKGICTYDEAFPVPQPKGHTLGLSPLNVLPRAVLWSGFLTNTVFYGLITWMMCAAPVTVRRHRRAKRNRCPDCGYNLRGADHGKCPECGEAVVAK